MTDYPNTADDEATIYATRWLPSLLCDQCGGRVRHGRIGPPPCPGCGGTGVVTAPPPRPVITAPISGARGVLDLVAAHSTARSMLGLTEPIRELPGRCQRGCGRSELRVKDGSDTIWCDHCKKTMTRDDYDRLGNVFLRGVAA